MSPTSSACRKSPPWRLLGTSVLLGLALTSTGLDPRPRPALAGRAQLRQALPPGQSGWQLQLDLPALKAGAVQQLTTRLGPVWGLEGASLELPAGSSVGTLKKLQGQPATWTPQEPARSPLSRDPLFDGSPAAVWEWSQGAFLMRGNLYSRDSRFGLFSGRVMGSLPFSGLLPTGDGFSLGGLRYFPHQVEKMVVIDPSLLRLAPLYRERLQKEWDRWEFFPFQELTGAIGRSMAYLRWKEESLFLFHLRDRATIEKEIARRFPDSVVSSKTLRAFGALIRGFEPHGPAWVLRGDTVIATPSGGVQRIEELLQLTMSDRSFHKPSALLSELQRLATDSQGWHAVILYNETKAPLRWGALVRWPEPGVSRVSGFLVIEAKPDP